MSMMLHAGARTVQRQELRSMGTPPATDTWQPIPHWILADKVRNAIEAQHLTLKREEYGVQDSTMPGKEKGQGLQVKDSKLFALFTLGNGASRSGYSHQIALRQSLDKRMSVTIAAGATVFICDNMCISATKLVHRKHTANIMADLQGLVDDALKDVSLEFKVTDRRYDAYKRRAIGTVTFNNICMQAVEAGALPYSRLSKVVPQWKDPTHPEFKRHGKSVWRMFNAFTEADKDANTFGNPERMRKLLPLIDEVAHFDPTKVVA
jgi:hypothetical protein